MSCCGETTAGRFTIRKQDIDEGMRVEIEYWGGRRIEIKGAVTHEIYTFSGLSRRGLVDPRDAPGLLLNSLFRLKGIVRKKVETNGATGSEAR